jgi:hypothetical protein
MGPLEICIRAWSTQGLQQPEGDQPGSRLFGDLVASCYDTHVKSHCRCRLLDLGCGKVPFYALYREYVLKPCA